MAYPRLIGIVVFIAALVVLTALWRLYPVATLTAALIALAMLLGLFWGSGRSEPPHD